MKVGFITVVLAVLMGFGTEAWAATAADCSNQVSIDDVLGVLYKPENLHGARGPTFLVQNAGERTGKRRLQIRDAQCKLISTFGLYATDWPYGARYYQKSGGSKHSAQRLLKLAKKAGSTKILIEGVKGKWIVVDNPLNRQGEVFSG